MLRGLLLKRYLAAWLSGRRTSGVTVFPQPSAPRRIFLVGEDRLLQLRVSRALRDDGHTVIEADGVFLVDRARAVSAGHAVPEIDMAVVDARQLDGEPYAALETVRRFDWVLPIVLLAPELGAHLEEQAWKLRANIVVTGPHTAERISSAVALLLQAERSDQ